MSITIPSDFLASFLRPGILYELLVSLGVEISDVEFRRNISTLNVKFISPRVIFSGSLQDKTKIKVFYSVKHSTPVISQRDIVSALREAFLAYYPEVVFEESPGEVPQAIPLVTPREEAPPLSLDWLKKGYQEIINSISEKTGLPSWAILPIAGSVLVLLIVALKTKPVVIIKK